MDADVDREQHTLAAVEPEVVEVARRAVHDTAAEVLDWSATPIAHVGIIDTTSWAERASGGSARGLSHQESRELTQKSN